MLQNNSAAVVLAAGKGTRMHSQKPKVLQTLLGEPMLFYVLSALKPVFKQNIVIVSGFQAQMLEAAFPNENFIRQKEQLGTGHAVMTALDSPITASAEYIIVVNGDSPLLSAQLLQNFINSSMGADIAFATIVLQEPGMYGRVVRKAGHIQAIVEAKDFCVDKHGPETGEINAGVYYFKRKVLQNLLPLLNNDNKSGEYYLTDIITLGIQASLDVRGIECGDNPDLLGVNSPIELSTMEEILRERSARHLLDKGVIIHAPQMLYVGPRVEITPGVEITAPCEIYGVGVIGENVVIGPNCVIRDCEIGPNAQIRPFCHLDHAIIGENAQVGPYTRLRPGARLEKGAHAGNFVELKKAVLGVNSKANHLSYLGDAEIGEGVNIGAGTITCNYDGKNKHKTIIGSGSFIGSNTALVAPVEIGPDTLIGAGSVITQNVPARMLAIARGRQKNLRRINYEKENN